MTTRTDVLAWLANPPSSSLDFQQDTLDDRALAEHLVALTNFGGGRLLLGVDDGGTPTGLTHGDLAGWVMTACRDNIRPSLIPYVEIIRDVAPGRDIAVVRVKPGYTLHATQHGNHLTYPIRIGSRSREASVEELAWMRQRLSAFRAELRAVNGTGLPDLDRRRLRDYFVRVRQQDVPGDDDEDGWRVLLRSTQVLADGEDGSVTVAGMLLFGRRVERFLPQSGVDAVIYPGAEKRHAGFERATLRGPLVALLDSSGEMVEHGLVEQATDFVRRRAPPTTTLEHGARRFERPAFPDDVVREVLVNALTHRDYQLAASNVELSVYSDRMEVVSPGRLPAGVTPAQMLVGTRTSCNQLLKDVMRDCGYLDHMGLGVPRKIVAGMRAHNGSKPVLEELGQRFRVTLWR